MLTVTCIVINGNFDWHPTSCFPAVYFLSCYKVLNVCIIMKNCV